MGEAARVLAIVALAGCGRLGFDAGTGADAAPVCVTDVPCTLPNLCLAGVESCDDVPVCLADQPIGAGTACAAGTCEPTGVCSGPAGTVVTPPGSTSDDLAGYSVALDGDWLIAGAPDSTVDTLTYAGAAFVMHREASGWVQTQRLTASDPAANDELGNYVAIDGTRLMIGARWRGAMDEGAVYAFEYDGSTWVQTDVITLPQPTAAIELGATIAIEGDRAVVAADFGAVDGSYGSAYVLERQPDATWTIVATLTSPAAERLGFSIDLDGDRVALGSLWDTGPSGVETGAVRIFQRDAAGAWAETDELWPATPPPDSYSDAIGSAVAFDGDRLVAGDQLYEQGPDRMIGGIIVYERDAAGAWIPVDHLEEAAPIRGGQLGRSLALQGDRLLATSIDWDTGEGRLSVFRRGGDGVWRQVARLSTPEVGNQAGYALGGHEVDAKLSAQGDEVVVGYPGVDRSATELNTGAIVVYDVSGL